MENYDTIISSDGEDGLETAKFTLPDLILLDVMMPGMSGYEVLDELKKDSKTKDIPVILVTGKAEEEAKTKNAAGFIKKPFRRDNVKAIVSSILKN
ncbi:MAG: response regulator [Defluviitaleaceae bacterium]|nr:response regulator [Defluviitaleaceae bacterium]